MSAPSGGRVEFRGSLARRALGALVLSVVLGAAALFLLPQLLPVTTTRSMRATLAITAAVIIVVLIWGNALWHANTRVVVDGDTVEIRRPGQLLHRWERSTSEFTSRVTKRYTNGIPSGVDRTLIVLSPGRRDEVNVPLSRERFTELVALLAPLADESSVAADAGEAEAAESRGPRTLMSRTFTPQATVLRRRARHSAVAAAVAAVIAVAVLVVALSGVLVRDDREIVTVVVMPILAVLVVVLGVLAVSASARARSVPARIDVGPGAITIDGQTFVFAHQRAVRLSPPAYPRRRLVIVDGGGARRRWLLGEPGASARVPEILPDYAELVAAVAANARGAESIVRLDLE